MLLYRNENTVSVNLVFELSLVLTDFEKAAMNAVSMVLPASHNIVKQKEDRKLTFQQKVIKQIASSLVMENFHALKWCALE